MSSMSDSLVHPHYLIVLTFSVAPCHVSKFTRNTVRRSQQNRLPRLVASYQRLQMLPRKHRCLSKSKKSMLCYHRHSCLFYVPHPFGLEPRNRKRSRYSQEYKLADSEDSIPESIDKCSADDRPHRNQHRDCNPSGVGAVDDSRSQGEGIGTSNRRVGDTD
jgi:hypothetical protein